MLRFFFLTLTLCTAFRSFSQKENASATNKISNSLKEFAKNKPAHDSIAISFSVRSANDIRELRHYTHIQSAYLPANVYIARIRIGDLQKLSQNPHVVFIHALHYPKEELSTGINDLTLNKVSYTHHIFSAINGDSINASVKERLFDTTDIDLKGRVFKTGLENATQTAHASSMATIVGGGANSSPFAKGVAWGSGLTSASFANLFPDADSVFQRNKITVQNHSYGTVVENFYGNEAVAYDVSAVNNPGLLHVFSSGNSGNITATTGPYANVTGYANLTGNFKHAKNNISVGATDSLNVMQGLSSKGPSHDGRVKPELVAFGEDGSSGAAALVSGTAALIQEAYKKTHSAQVPPSSLVKAVLLNSADDVGASGIDFTSGYGSLNAFKAVQTIRSNSFFTDAVVNNQTKTFSVNVPNGIRKLKITLTWIDPAAAPNATKALVNDLDLVVRNVSTSQTWLPWVLNQFPHVDSLQLPAQRKQDTVNNVEQITVDNPAAGNYSIEVTGGRVTANQNFSIAYQWDTADHFYFTYPTGSDPLISGNTHTLRWETDIAGTGVLEYATNGSNWRTFGSVPDLSKKWHRWNLPDTVSLAKLRMNIFSSAASFLSDTFNISPQLNMDLGFNCADSFLLFWNRLPVGQYRLYELGNKYLESFAQTADTSVILKKMQHPSIYYSVAPLIGNKTGIKSSTLNYVAQGTGCYIKTFFLQSQTVQSAIFRAELGSLFNVVEVALEKFDGNNFVTVQTIPNPVTTIFDLTDTELKQGENFYRFRVKLNIGTLLYSNTELVYHFAELPVVVYPNPVAQNKPVNIINNESGRFTLQIIDENGRLIYSQLLTRTLTQIPSYRLSKGIYFVRIQDKNAKNSVQKLVVY